MPVRWGIAGSGAISADFALGVLASEHATLTAVAARTEERAQAFAKTYGASKSYGSYKALAQDPDIDVVYVGVTNQQHKHVSSLLLNAGKGVLCEKPATTSGADTAELINTALANNVFFMEGVWTKFFPIYTQLCSLIQDGHLGRVTYFSAAFAPGNELNEDATHEELLSKQRLWDPEYYGGILVDMGMYPLAMALDVFDGAEPEEMCTLGVKGVKEENGPLHMVGTAGDGVDVQGALSARFPNDGFASIRWGMRGQEEERFVVSGTKATASIAPSAHAPENMKVVYHAGEKKGKKEEFQYKLPNFPKGFARTNYPNSMGFKYEVDAVSNAIQQGKLECDMYPHSQMQTLANTLEQARKQMGVYYPHEECDNQPEVTPPIAKTQATNSVFTCLGCTSV